MRRFAIGSSASLLACVLGVSALLGACTHNQPQAKPGAVAAGERYFPTGAQGTSAVLLRQYSPSEVRVGEEYEGSVDVVNLTEADLQNVSVNLKNLSNVQLVSSTPEWTHSNGEVVWTLPVLPAGRTETIRFRAKATAAGAATNCLSVSYANLLCASTTVVEPALQLTKTATPEVCGTCADITLTKTADKASVSAGDQIGFTITVTNVTEGTTFAGWSGGATLDATNVGKYAIGGASSPTATDGVKPTSTVSGGNLVLTAIVRVDDPKLTVVGEAVGNLTDYGTPASITSVTGSATGIDQTGVPAGCEKQAFTVAQDGARKFLRLKATLAP